jgi:hypothetical protein
MYEPDVTGSRASSRVAVLGYTVGEPVVRVLPHSYKSPMGSPLLPASYRATYSQLAFGVPIKRASWGLFIKMFVTLYVAVALAIGAFYLRFAGERLALQGTALFVVIVNALATAALIPNSGSATLADVVNGLGCVAIGVTILQSLLLYRHFPLEADLEAVSVFDRLSLVLITACFFVVQAGVLLGAVL